jgi:predicted permease
MDNFIFSVNSIMPLFVTILIGYALRRFGFASKRFIDDGNKLAANILIPCLLFYNIYNADFTKTFDPKLLCMCIGGLFITFSIAYFAARAVSRQDDMRGAAAQGMARSNSVIFSLELMKNLYGTAGEMVYSVVAAFFVPMANFLNVLILSLYDPKRRESSLGKQLVKIVLNPFIVAGILGIAVNLSGIKLPASASITLQNVGKIGSTFTLLLVGMDFEYKNVGKNLPKILTVSFFKLLLFPSVILTISYFLGFRDIAFAVVLTGFCPPTAVASYAMAKMMHANTQFAAQIVVFYDAFFGIYDILYIFLSRSLGIL